MKPTSRRSTIRSSPGWNSRSTASRTRLTVARSISPRGATTNAEPWRRVATSRLPGAATRRLPSSHLLTPIGGRPSAWGVRPDETGSHGRGLLALEVDCGIHPPHHVGGQTTAERIEWTCQPRAVLARQVAPDNRGEVLEREQVARVR